MDNNDMKKARAAAWFIAFVTSWGYASIGFFAFTLTREWTWLGVCAGWFVIAVFLAAIVAEVKRKDGK